MKKLIVLFLLLNGFAQAQEKQKLFNWTRTGIYGEYGARQFELDGLNKILLDSGYASFDNLQDSYGFGFTGRTEKWVFQVNYYRFSQCEETPAEFCSHLEYNGFGFSFGYNILKNNRNHLYPLVGLYKSKSQILISNNAMPVQPFGTYLTLNHNISQAVRHNYNLHLGIGYDHFFPLGEKYSSELFLGFRSGYNIEMDNNYWEIHEEVELTNEPDLKLGGLYFHGVLGFTF